MKRLHVHVSVDNLDQSIRFYSTLFAAEPTVLKDDYAKWMLEDPRVNFAISKLPGRAAGISHLGIQAEDEGELADVYDRLTGPSGRSSKRKGPPAATPSRTNSGSPTRKACLGRRSSLTAKPPSTARDRSPS
jgi:catechol 2,3-dioxygenase-like lactoylglutathione lyase family enzyme